MMLLLTKVVSELGAQTTATHQIRRLPHPSSVNPENPWDHAGY